MIVFIEGTLLKSTPLNAVISTGGLGYSVTIPVTTAEKLPPNGETVSLHTHTVYREDSQALYGFWDESERDFFALIIDKVSGVGPKVAISLMSKLPLDSLVAAIASENSILLSKTPGIGKKTAERVIIELKDKLTGFATQQGTSVVAGGTAAIHAGSLSSNSEDAVLALQALGFKPNDARKAIEKVVEKLGSDLSTEALVKAALN